MDLLFFYISYTERKEKMTKRKEDGLEYFKGKCQIEIEIEKDRGIDKQR